MSYQKTKSYKSFMRSPYRSIKHKSYFNVYDTLLEEYIGKEITFVEIGILDGGSLFMWRDFFGEQARIIGIEINESSKVWQDHGFEVYIGSQGDIEFWKEFYNSVGDIDVLLDDGGHTYQQQIITVESALQHLKPKGKIIVEDTYTSYQKEYGSPSNYSFMKYAFNLVDGMNFRTPVLNSTKNDSTIHNVSFFESIVSIKLEEEIDLSLGKGIANDGAILGENISESLRYADKSTLTQLTSVIVALKSLEKTPFIGKVFKRIGVLMINLIKIINNKKDNYKLRKYFRY